MLGCSGGFCGEVVAPALIPLSTPLFVVGLDTRQGEWVDLVGAEQAWGAKKMIYGMTELYFIF